MAHTLDDLRDHLFDTLKALKDKEKPMEIDRAKAISEVAQTVINSAKVEVEYVKAVGRDHAALPVFGAANAPALEDKTSGNGSGVRTHRIRG